MEQSELLRMLVQTCEHLGVRYQITGSQATIAHGEPRFTIDIDIVVDLREGQAEAFAACFPAPDFYLSGEAMREAIRDRRQFNILHPASGQKIDVILLPDSDAARSQWQRSRRLPVAGGYEADFIAPEDVILRKMEYYTEGGSDKHLRDIAGILKIQADKIDRAYIAGWAARLGLTELWNAVAARAGQG
jgi:hypothetical protein